MSNVAYVTDGIVTNVALGDADFAAQTGGIFTEDKVAKGWSYDGASFAPPAPVDTPAPVKRNGLTQGEFRLLFTFAERQAEAAFKRAAEAAAQAGTASNEQLVYLTMRDDFDSARVINLDDPATQAALDFYVAFGLLTEARKAVVLTGERP